MSIYLDHNATSPVRPEAVEAMVHALSVAGNPSAPHSHGRAASRLISDAREAVGLAMGVCAQDIIFTGSGTEADNTAIYAAFKAGSTHMLFSSMDHPATISVAENHGISHEVIPVNHHGQTDMEWLERRLADWDADMGRPFVSLVAANSETGVVQDCERATELVHAAGGLILIDAVQALGKLPMNYLADYIAVSAHKIGGPQGVGALYVSRAAPMSAYLTGGGQERRRRAGTMTVAGISGFGAAAQTIAAEVAADLGHTQHLRDQLEAGLSAVEPELVIFGKDTARLPNTSFFAVPDMSSTTLMMSLDLAGVSVSTGIACSSGKVGANRALTAMGMSGKAPKGPIRISLGYTTTQADVDGFLAAWGKIRGKALDLKGAA